jgi:hypothetical protein
MKTIKRTLVISLLLLMGLSVSQLQAQAPGNTATNTISLGMPEVFLLQSNSAQVNLTLSPQTAGLAVSSSVSSDAARLLISSVVTGDQTRKISAQITGNAVPAGTYLNLVAQAPNANFVGTAGTYSQEVELSSVTAKDIITGIGTCYSNTSADDGYKLRYTFGIPSENPDYALIRASGGTVVTVTLTLSAGI